MVVLEIKSGLSVLSTKNLGPKGNKFVSSDLRTYVLGYYIWVKPGKKLTWW